HTAPNIPHYAKNKAKGVMKSGHVFTIEPMINLGMCSATPAESCGMPNTNADVCVLPGVWQDVHWPDGWTAVTADGRRSAQFEHTVTLVVFYACSCFPF